MSGQTETLETLLRRRQQDLIEAWIAGVRAAVASEPLPQAELLDHMPNFVASLLAALHPEAIPLPGPSSDAAEHGAQRLRLGFDVGEVVREYGILHQCILHLAGEEGLAIAVKEQDVLGRWLNRGIADAVSQYVVHRDAELQRQASEHLGFIAHEIRNPLSAARLAFGRLRTDGALAGHPLADRMERSLQRTTEVIDSALTHAWLSMGVPLRPEPVALEPLLKDICGEADAEAENKGLRLRVAVDRDLTIDADPRLLRSAVANLVLNAVKFSRSGGEVKVTARRAEERAVIEVADSCGGLPPGKAEELFSPTVQRGSDRSGFGLGLAIAMQAAQAHHGTLRVRDIPGHGCVFIAELPLRLS